MPLTTSYEIGVRWEKPNFFIAFKIAYCKACSKSCLGEQSITVAAQQSIPQRSCNSNQLPCFYYYLLDLLFDHHMSKLIDIQWEKSNFCMIFLIALCKIYSKAIYTNRVSLLYLDKNFVAHFQRIKFTFPNSNFKTYTPTWHFSLK